MGKMETWQEMFEECRTEDGDTSPVVAVAPDESVLDVAFDSDYGSSAGPAVLIWTEERVYFPVVYDGAEWLESVPRNPVPHPKGHVGGQ